MNEQTSRAGSTIGEAYAEALDPKYMRTKMVQRDPTCLVCHHGAPPELGHALGCPLATMADAKIAVEKARKNEEWARERAAFWLLQVRHMHGKLSMLKAELRKVRSNVKYEPRGGKDSDG